MHKIKKLDPSEFMILLPKKNENGGSQWITEP